MQISTFESLKKDLPAEITRVGKIVESLKGRKGLEVIFNSHFSEPWEPGVNLVYELSRVNMLRSYRGESKLC